ncbi:hypothetical protein KIK84_11995 [Curvibacter sp. CHRR-16]|uniref:hypothetical protein n=1 Tax=Curvibacter sp. CHRR-16 TaxID=2835872 RepID=UPI001BD987B6|nr:hypothetical protein [Curvibacter sp. CHRR-16]MBT0571052.1 hypothetical protein [Curvibacter sp. CHRR-16]
MSIAGRYVVGLWLIVWLFAGNAWGAGVSERTAILDAARPKAAEDAGQPVRIKVDRLNIDSGWAMLIGELVGPPGKRIDWAKAANCNPDLDNMFWAVLHKVQGIWQVKLMEICAAEPPYWYLDAYDSAAWPCGVLAGLEAGYGESLEAQCRREHKARQR